MSERIDLFLSYDFSDGESVEALADAIKATGLRVWHAKPKVKAGHWRTKVEDAIDGASAFLVAVSSSTTHSKEVENEFRRAEAAGKPILAVFLEACSPPLYAGSVHAAYYHVDSQAALEVIAELVEDAAETRRTAELSYLERVRRTCREDSSTYFPLTLDPVSEGVTSSGELDALVGAAVAKFTSAYEPEPSSVLDRLDALSDLPRKIAQPRVALVGDPGAGKTMTLRKLMDELAEAAQSDALEPVPVFIPLRRYSGSRPFFEYVRDVCRRQLGELSPYFAELLAASRLALLIDGLNEMPSGEVEDDLREIRAFLDRHRSAFVALTCREVDYTPAYNLGLDTITISPLTPIQVRQFLAAGHDDVEQVDRLFWSLVGDNAEELYEDYIRAGGDEAAFWLYGGKESPLRRKTLDRPYYQWNLWIEVRDNPLSLLALARNPYLASMILKVYKATGENARNRHDLFTIFVDVMYEAGKKAFQGTKSEWIEKDDQVEHLTALARAMHERGVMTLPSAVARDLLPDALATRFLAIAEDERILDCSDGVTFSHQLLREYFASVYVEAAWKGGGSADAFFTSDEWWVASGWEEAIIFLVGKHANEPTRLLNWLRDGQPELASQCIVQTRAEVSEPHRQSLATAWLARLQGPGEPPAGRAAVGRALGRLNLDTRPGVCLLDSDGLPAIEWASIPESTVCVGGVEVGRKTPEFSASRYLITNAHFQPFIDGGGYTEEHRDCWTETGWNWRLMADRQGPDDYTEVFTLPNHPRIGTVWYEAYAYTRWLTKRYRDLGVIPDDHEIRLPTEAEWEALVRGPEGARLYPWGDEFSYDKCHIRDIRSTCAVGLYPEGASPEGVYDLVGNAWAWCLTTWNDDPTVQDNGPEGDDPRVYRGGSWAFDFNVSRWRPEELAGDQRYWIVPLDDRPDAIGFFIVRGQCLRP